MLGSKEIGTTNNADIYRTNKDLYLVKKSVKRCCFKV